MFFLGAEKERDRAPTEVTTQLGQNRRIRVEFGEVASTKLVPLLGIVLVPPTQIMGRRHGFRPEVDMRICLRYAARPEPVDQNALAVGRAMTGVDSLGPKVHEPPPDDRPLESVWGHLTLTNAAT